MVAFDQNFFLDFDPSLQIKKKQTKNYVLGNYKVDCVKIGGFFGGGCLGSDHFCTGWKWFNNTKVVRVH